MLEAYKKPNGPNVILIGTEGDTGPHSFNLPKMMIMATMVMMVCVQVIVHSLEFRSLTT
jgi:hypothetical protein